MTALKNIDLNLDDIFYKKKDLPKISLGDKVRVVIYLELPKEVAEGEKKRKRAYSSVRRCCNFATLISNKNRFNYNCTQNVPRWWYGKSFCA
jgi:hypothetical protein